ncbi:FdtA/QdtA family cupin domain-containing protein [uncultured Parabacteroides sp.]|uniref:sugar 3,4-ketoisomerase n=1 Tax=uncultured Parabacteroides sp. TaxID=512312 RepID=UPI0025D38AFC|nr:FdtA/QdtA family cupin domain-containing protein [uncultured Parabacteroides sp.]
MNVFDCSIIQLPRIENKKGNITPSVGLKNIPFDIEWVFYTYDIPGGEARGAHAHKECHQLLVTASGSFEAVLDDGINRRTILLNRPCYGLHIFPDIWAAEQRFSSGSICLVLAFHKYDESDYIRNYNDFLLYLTLLNTVNIVAKGSLYMSDFFFEQRDKEVAA